MAESFDSYNAPQFFDFSKDLHTDEISDAYFEIDHENMKLVDPLKYEENSTCTVEECINVYIREVSEIKLTDTMYENTEEVKQEESLEEYSPANFSSDKDTEDETIDNKKLRRSMSIESFFPLYEPESITENKSKSNNTTSNATTVYPISEPEKSDSRNKSLYNFKKAGSNMSLNKHKAGPSRSSSPRLATAASREKLNKLAQPKRYASANNLDQNSYVSMAEAVRKFQSGTPARFRTKPKLDPNCITKLGKTIPHSPALLTKQRHRPVNVISREEREQLEYEEAQKFKIKANPFNKRMLQGPLRPLVPIEKKCPTIPEPFKITAAPRRIPESPKKEVFEFHAKPAPKSLHEPPKSKDREKVVTIPMTPTFMKRYAKELVKQDQQENVLEIKPSFKPLRTVPVPFSFEHRDQLVQKMKKEKIKKVLEEEKKSREFHARPVPKAILNRAKNSSLRRSNSANNKQPKEFSKSDDNISNQFKAKPPIVLSKKPFEPKMEERHLIEITEFQLNTEIRAKEREEFEQLKKEKEERIALAKQLEEELRLRKEEEEVARLRKETEYRAQPIKKYKELKIEPSGKVTEPISPKFQFNKHKSKENEENSNKDSL